MLRNAFLSLALVGVLFGDFASLAAQAADTAKVLRVGVPSRPPGLGNPYSTLPIGVINPMHTLYDGLTAIGDNREILPALATSWEPDPNNGWVFTLRPDVVFSNGEPFNAQTVVDVLAYLRGTDAGGYPVANETAMIKSAEVVDDLTVRIVTHQPDALLPRRMSFVFMVPMKYFSDVGVDEFGLAPGGTGPFKVKDWGLASGSYVYERNPTSWRRSAHFDELEFIAVGDPISRAQAMISGQIDLSFKLSLDQLADLDAEGFKTIARQTYSIGTWAFKQMNADSPVADVRVRRALNLAVNRDAIAQAILNGVAVPVSQVATPDVFGYNPGVPMFPYDPDQARGLLAEAGFPNGLKLEAIVRSDPSVPESLLINQVVAQNLRDVGVDVTMNTTPGSRWLIMYFSGDWDDADMLETSFNNSIHGDVIRSIETASCIKAGAFYCREDLMPLIEESNRTLDAAKREPMLQRLVKELHDDPPGLYLFPYFDTVAYRPTLGDMPMTGLRIDLDRITEQP